MTAIDGSALAQGWSSPPMDPRPSSQFSWVGSPSPSPSPSP
eukprot:CAMPEP_0173367538 /NCGR_PEP_ID=MMETSP1144-20121109/24914_1 /TAXON_ID=483371 /ORGANISM="non described non described, Strain CCMP2298" /LENGTH=40 /DNA_ID= /DNA_START= /DNA_END= /DNA_ORIENTATION=